MCSDYKYMIKFKKFWLYEFLVNTFNIWIQLKQTLTNIINEYGRSFNHFYLNSVILVDEQPFK